MRNRHIIRFSFYGQWVCLADDSTRSEDGRQCSWKMGRTAVFSGCDDIETLKRRTSTKLATQPEPTPRAPLSPILRWKTTVSAELQKGALLPLRLIACPDLLSIVAKTCCMD